MGICKRIGRRKSVREIRTDAVRASPRRCSRRGHDRGIQDHRRDAAPIDVCQRLASARSSPGARRPGPGETPLVSARCLFRVGFVSLLAGCALLVAAAHAEGAAPPRQIAPALFAPTPRAAAAGAAARATIVMPPRERPLGPCERTARDWLTCLAATAQLSDSAVEDTN